MQRTCLGIIFGMRLVEVFRRVGELFLGIWCELWFDPVYWKIFVDILMLDFLIAFHSPAVFRFSDFGKCAFLYL